ncbi:MAG: Hpt domain-containing protein, partial [Spirochaetales bacterium]|nr:Hpt domain-containing protein [Spirochaetales bacterium]
FKNADIEAVLSRLRQAGAFEAGHGLRQTIPVNESEGDAASGGGENGRTARVSEPGSPIDVPATVDAFMGDIEIVEKIVRKFAAGLDEQIDKVEQYIRDARLSDARIVAHAIKGGAWNLSSPDLGAAAKAIEEACIAEDKETAHNLIAPLRDEAHRFERFVSTLDFSAASM